MLRPAVSERAWKDWKFSGADAWTDWAPFSKEIVATLPPSAGAYMLGVPNGRSIHRLIGVDPHGILDIGEATSLRRRLASMLRCVRTPEARGHMAGWRLGTLGLLELIGLKPDDLRLAWMATANKHFAVQAEGAMLRVYLERFGEPPPLNYQFNWSAFRRPVETEDA